MIILLKILMNCYAIIIEWNKWLISKHKNNYNEIYQLINIYIVYHEISY